MALERTYTIPLRPGFRNAPAYYRTNKAMRTLRLFLMRHMKVKEDKIRIGQHLNEEIWRNGIKNPPARITVIVKKSDDGMVLAELVGKDYKGTVKPLAKSEGPQGLKERLQSAIGGGKKADAQDEEKAEKAEDLEKNKAAIQNVPQ